KTSSSGGSKAKGKSHTSGGAHRGHSKERTLSARLQEIQSRPGPAQRKRQIHAQCLSEHPTAAEIEKAAAQDESWTGVVISPPDKGHPTVQVQKGVQARKTVDTHAFEAMVQEVIKSAVSGIAHARSPLLCTLTDCCNCRAFFALCRTAWAILPSVGSS
ncbi:MAG: hypothetical protein P4M11_03365, partial [Candidatus Pacebacteria bacterium]|nr:hypothetical protein [Candidatus Paceibacterota bacterium]